MRHKLLKQQVKDEISASLTSTKSMDFDRAESALRRLYEWHNGAFIKDQRELITCRKSQSLEAAVFQVSLVCPSARQLYTKGLPPGLGEGHWLRMSSMSDIRIEIDQTDPLTALVDSWTTTSMLRSVLVVTPGMMAMAMMRLQVSQVVPRRTFTSTRWFDHGIMIDCLKTLLEETAGFVCYEGNVALIEKPEDAARDASGKWHSDHGPSVIWRDGSADWYLGGVKVEGRLVMDPESYSIDEIKKTENLEVRRLMIQRWAGTGHSTDGWRKYLKAIGAKQVDRRMNDIENTIEKLLVGADKQVLLVCACPSTARVYALEVPRTVSTCEQAQEWLWSGSVMVSLLQRSNIKLNIVGRS